MNDRGIVDLAFLELPLQQLSHSAEQVDNGIVLEKECPISH